ncbi:hypothetical protein MMC29_006896, partial [Sticta canariensis]|nr:hypothetical protein [Sticta canariensis]
MSTVNDVRIATLEEKISALSCRIQQLEKTVAIPSKKLGAKITRTVANLAGQPDGRCPSAPLNTKPASGGTFACPYNTSSVEDRANGTEPISSPVRGKRAPKKPVSAAFALIEITLISKTAPVQHSPGLNDPQPEQIAFIQRLHADGVDTEEICKRAMDKYPDLCKQPGQDREAFVLSTAELNTS